MSWFITWNWNRSAKGERSVCLEVPDSESYGDLNGPSKGSIKAPRVWIHSTKFPSMGVNTRWDWSPWKGQPEKLKDFSWTFETCIWNPTQPFREIPGVSCKGPQLNAMRLQSFTESSKTDRDESLLTRTFWKVVSEKVLTWCCLF